MMSSLKQRAAAFCEIGARVRATLRSQREQLADLRREVGILAATVGAKSGWASNASGARALDAALLNAAAQRAELERVANLHESSALAISALSKDVEALKLVAACRKEPSGEARQEPGGDNPDNRLAGPLKARFRMALQKTTAPRRGAIFAPVLMRLTGAMYSFGGVVRLFDQMVDQYALVVKERDSLLNERDVLLKSRQEADRRGGLDPHAEKVHAKGRLAFPAVALPSGKAPKIVVVDIGAQNLTQEAHIYAPLQAVGAARLIGFEPLAEAASLRRDEDPSMVMLQHFIGNGRSALFHIGRDDTTSSLLAPDLDFLARFEALPEMCEPVKIERVQTTRLDDVSEIDDCDFLKIDVQGGELDVLTGAPNTLKRTLFVHCEVEFAPVYQKQPLFSDIDAHLRAAGFELVDIINAGYATTKGLPRPISRSRLMWAEAVYARSPETITLLGADKALKAAYIAHVNYGMYDIAAQMLNIYDSLAASQFGLSYGLAITRPEDMSQ